MTTIDAARPEEVYILSKEVSGSELHTTQNIRIFGLFFTERGLRELSLEQRLALSQSVRTALRSKFLALPRLWIDRPVFPSAWGRFDLVGGRHQAR